ncbi:hypothetical protein WNY78_04440 [Psychroserpens sp. AS72]|uniref:hypothetical protein n=1 Tax=Psychroserpens sp. AS72 TaxID=3135775 RepID=UPI0031764B0A
MKNLFFIILALLTFNAGAQSNKIVLTEMNFDTEFLKYEAIQKDIVSKENFDYAEMILSQTRKKLKNDIKNYNVTHYWNIATAFSTLNESKENIEIVFKKATKSKGVCEYFKSFKDVPNHFSEDIPDLYKKEEQKCMKKLDTVEPLNPIVYSNKYGYDLKLIQLINQVDLDDKKFRNSDYANNISKQSELDKKNQKIIDSLYNKYKSYLGTSATGKKLNNVMWKVIQHSNVEMMEKYLPVIQEAVKNNEISMTTLKMLIDRVCWEKYEYQIFGSQAGVKIADEKTRIEIIKKYGIE